MFWIKSVFVLLEPGVKQFGQKSLISLILFDAHLEPLDSFEPA